MRRGVPIFSAEATRLLNRGPAWREQYTLVEERRMEAEERELERWWDEEGYWLLELPEAEMDESQKRTEEQT